MALQYGGKHVKAWHTNMPVYVQLLFWADELLISLTCQWDTAVYQLPYFLS